MSDFELDANDPAAMAAHLQTLGWGSVDRAQRIGDGNMNMTVRAWHGDKTFILKQARPWVVKYPQIAAPIERAAVEARFYSLVASTPGVASRMPRLLGFDEESHLLMLQDLGDFQIETPTEATVIELTAYLVGLHKIEVDSFPNRAMRALNHEHQYEFPLRADNGLGFEALAAPLLADSEYCARVKSLGQRYLADGNTLLHGDFFPGSWLNTSVIDPEFCYLGDAEYDLGVFLAHLELLGLGTLWPTVITHYTNPVNWTLARNYAGAEIMRRLIGVAQLPLKADLEQKRQWLRLSRELVCQ
ncbi:MAG: phosphotransferase [Acidobacteria bacterium]|nr:phosphotransferase [Acidobacteriota bacterium]